MGPKTRLSLEASASSNIWTLERRSADQLAGLGRVTFEPDNRNRVSFAAGLRRRYYADWTRGPGRLSRRSITATASEAGISCRSRRVMKRSTATSKASITDASA